MKKATFSVTLLSALFSFGSYLTVEATSIPIALVDGDWANAVPSVTIANSGVSGGLSTARWGTPASSAGQSGYDFLSATTPFNAPADGTPFALGSFSHINFPITGTALDTINLNLTLGNVINVSTTFAIDHNETPNTNIPPDDFVTIVNPLVNQLFTYLGNNYYFNLIGFSQNGGVTITSVFQTQESAVNTAVLYGRITTQPVSTPEAGSTMAMLGLAFLGFGAVRRKLT